MSRASRNRRRLAATLLATTLAVLACAPPLQASPLNRRRSMDDSVLAEPLHALFSLVLQLFEKGGGGMDPNGCH